MDAGYALPRASRLHRVECRDRTAQETSVLGLPPSVDDDRLALAYDVVVPPPDRRLDRLAHRGHMLEAVIVFPRLVGPGTPERPYRCRRGVKDIDGKLFGDTPRPPRVGMGGKPLIHHRGSGQRQRPVDDIGVTRNPANVGHAPIDILRV